jgi:hypothetical protein
LPTGLMDKAFFSFWDFRSFMGRGCLPLTSSLPWGFRSPYLCPQRQCDPATYIQRQWVTWDHGSTTSPIISNFAALRGCHC